MSDEHCFISYSNAISEEDTIKFAYKLADKLKAGPPSIDIWIDDRSMHAGDWDEQVSKAIKTCKCFLFLVSPDSVAEGSICTDEWNWAIKYKKPIIPLILQRGVEVPFRLSRRNFIDFTGNFETALSKLRNHIDWLDSPEGLLQSLRDRLGDAQRDLRRNPENSEQIQSDIDDLRTEIKANEFAKNEPKKAQKQTRDLINAGLERDREPINPTGGKTSSKFINPRPGSIPDYFEGRLVETEEIADFLRNDYQRIMTINGRAGSGKTILACRVLEQLENGRFPNELGEFKVGGIVYLSEISNYKVNVANIFSGLLELIEPQKASKVSELYKEAKVPVDEKIRALLAALPVEPVILLMDNFEDLLKSDSEAIIDQELYIALTTILQADSHSLKILITTRELPRQLNMIEPARQHVKHLEEGLPSPFAENVLRKMDKNGSAGFRDATDELLGRVREATLGYPRALEALYAILRVDRYSNVEELLVEGVPDTVVEKFVGEAFSRLDTTSQKIIQVSAVYNRPVSSAAVDFALQFHVSGVNSAPILERLVSMHFVRREAKRYFLHPADRDYALSRMPQGENNKKIGQGARARTWDQHSLTLRAADYFVEVRKPRAEWKKLDDLAPQLAEYDLRFAAGDYNSASKVLQSIDYDYLHLWGHYQLTIEMHEKLQGKLTDEWLNGRSIDLLGSTYATIGQSSKAIYYYNKALQIAHENKYRQGEAASLGNLGSAYADLANTHKAIEYYEKALTIDREVGHRTGEGYALGNLGVAYLALGNAYKAIEYLEKVLTTDRKADNRTNQATSLNNLGYVHLALGDTDIANKYYEQGLEISREIGDRSNECYSLCGYGFIFLDLNSFENAINNFIRAIAIADDINRPKLQNVTRRGLSQAYLSRKNLVDARTAIEAAIQYNEPQNNHDASALYGIIALRQGEASAALQAFTRAIAQADEILAKTPEYYSALDAKGLALAGQVVSGEWKVGSERERDEILAEAVRTFKRAREIAPHAGVVKSVLRLFDELVKCEGGEILKDVRKAVEGSE